MSEQEQALHAWCRELSERLTDQHEMMMDLKHRLEKAEARIKGIDARTSGMIVYGSKRT